MVNKNYLNIHRIFTCITVSAQIISDVMYNTHKPYDAELAIR